MVNTLLFRIGTAALLTLAVEAASQPLNYTQVIQPPDAAVDNSFGAAIELVDGKLYIGATGRQNGGASGMGAVYVFDSDRLALCYTITASNAAPIPEPFGFGRSIAVQGDHLLVGSSKLNPNDDTEENPVYLMQISTGTQIDRYTDVLAAPRRSSPDFGHAVALAGDFAIVGDPDAISDTPVARNGVASFFNIQTGQQETRLAPSRAAYFGDFGRSIDTRGNKVYIAGRFATGLNAYDPETRRIIDRLSPPVETLFFGFGMAIFDDMLAAADSAYMITGFESYPTAVYLFDLNSNELIRTFTVDPDPGDIGLGRFVTLNEHYLLATRLLPDDEGSNVLVFDIATGDMLKEIKPPVGSELNFGSAMVLDGDLAYIASPPSDDYPLPGGAVLVYDLSQLNPCPADVNDDGDLTPADFNAWIDAFNTNAPACNQNFDAACSPADFAAWVVNYNTGCN